MTAPIFIAIAVYAFPVLAASDTEFGIAAGEFVYPSVLAEKLMTGECRRYFKRPHRSVGDIEKVLEDVPASLKQAAARQLSPEALAASTERLAKEFNDQWTWGTAAEFSSSTMCGLRVGAMLGLRQKAMTTWNQLVSRHRAAVSSRLATSGLTTPNTDPCHESGSLASNAALARGMGKPLAELIAVAAQVPDDALRKETEAMIIDVYTTKLSADAAYMKYRNLCRRR